ncbi:LOG family protein [Streptococcus porcinus]|uniref:Cytokinin riboside 5'-monophosphate phosphoribohydrolase n=2 Tax=Streptococcus porcinus TaxID=1340 RepID=A0A4V0GYI6_STRPO|nr:TIGR00730 family Rossman fold protein [Streptococcus porcinus]EGJ27358.1 TIGR00730 family protein [Streptococcus porcinus str. Jelinkova 176]MBA2796211.1 TIGR00730 family Rossman fold protein [Streptococcus porcinus]SQG42679.1 Lysine decarboxylase family [Streptococcus porcinus]VTT41701.1 Lysine decarboxylase family [Streptococcus porcinus]VTT42812.1 Lysine decarboxylase family [Streptococcus porcinus]
MKITIFCGASTGSNPIYSKKTRELALWMAQNNHGLVYGGGKIGLMGIMANTIIENKGHAIGVMPTFLKDKEIAHANLSEFIVVDDMPKRKAKMMALGEVFIALPGGPGTLEEISEVISWSRIGQNDKPCILFNINGYFNQLKKMFDHMVAEGFLSQSDRDNILFSQDISEIEKFILNYQPPTPVYGKL